MAHGTTPFTHRDLEVSIGEDGAFNTSTGADVALKELFTLTLDGDISLDFPEERLTAFDRGSRTGAKSRKGTDQLYTGSFSQTMMDIDDATFATLVAIINKTGYVASDWATASTDSDLQTFMLRFKWTDPASNTHFIIFDEASITGSVSGGDGFHSVAANFEALTLYTI